MTDDILTVKGPDLPPLANVDADDEVAMFAPDGRLSKAQVGQLVDALNRYAYAQNTERLTAIEVAIQSFTAAGVIDVVKTTRANLDADLAHPDASIGWVHSDPVGNNNDLYKKVGASGAGTWEPLRLFKPKNGWYECTADGSGNAVVLAPDADFGTVTDRKVFFWTSIGQNNGNMTLAVPGINGGVGAPLLLPSGDQVPPQTTKLNFLCAARYRPATGTYELILPQVRAQPMRVLCNATMIGSALTLTIAQAAIPIPGDLSNVIFEYEVPADKPAGGATARIRDVGGTELLAATTLLDADGAAIGELGWRAGEMQQIRRQIGGYGADNGTLKRLSVPDTITPALSALSARIDAMMPPAEAPVLLTRMSTGMYSVTIGGIACDNVDDFNRADRHCFLLYDFGRASSYGVLKSTTAIDIYAQYGIVDGRRFDFMNVASDEVGGGLFDGIQPSTIPYAMRVGSMADGLNDVFGDGKPKHDFYGIGHVQIQAVPGSQSMIGEYKDFSDGLWKNSTNLIGMKIGSSRRFRKLTLTGLYDVYRPPTGAPIRIGQAELVLTFDKDGMFIVHTHKVGRSLPYNLGSSQVNEGDVLTGATSGATATVVCVPETGIAGSWGTANRSGEFFVKSVVGNFQAGEDLRVGGIARCKATGNVGPQVSNQNSYSAMAALTSVNRFKVKGQPEITIGLENGTQHPAGIGTWAGASRIAARHTRIPDALFELILYRNVAGNWVESACPIDPPGDFSECDTTQLWVQDREEGIRKLYINGRSGVAVRAWEGKFVTAVRHRLRKGAAQ